MKYTTERPVEGDLARIDFFESSLLNERAIDEYFKHVRASRLWIHHGHIWGITGQREILRPLASHLAKLPLMRRRAADYFFKLRDTEVREACTDNEDKRVDGQRNLVQKSFMPHAWRDLITAERLVVTAVAALTEEN